MLSGMSTIEIIENLKIENLTENRVIRRFGWPPTICVRPLGMIRPIFAVLWLCDKWERTNISDRYNGDWSVHGISFNIYENSTFQCHVISIQCNLFSKSWVGFDWMCNWMNKDVNCICFVDVAFIRACHTNMRSHWHSHYDLKSVKAWGKAQCGLWERFGDD